ncbi:hypothetical protein RCH16_003624 [Cryobacterium sp. MP_M5]|nr:MULTISPECIES: hypothetical protein [unclassified Cryobacterium]MBG6060149.1 hypothetical protein [Cryobacterium sp. MP_M3]MEC5178585.1 hypothetical protein [Cryobacterium sp. MP_M5]
MHFVALHRQVLTKASPDLQLGEALSVLQERYARTARRALENEPHG